MENAAYAQLETDLGNLESQFDLILFCLPPGSGDWLAYGECECRLLGIDWILEDVECSRFLLLCRHSIH